jgi:hypothetical protein
MTRTWAAAAAVAVGLAAMLVTPLVGAAPSYAAPSPIDAPSTTSTVPVTTTVPTTTTTLPPTTTTLPPTTTSTTGPPHPTTTTAPTTTTTTPHHAPAHSSTSTPWGLVALIIVLALAIILVIVLLIARRSRARQAAWRRAALPALSDARLARDALLSGDAESGDEQLRAAVGLQVERAATALDGAVERAAEPPDADAARAAASSLRGLAFAIEADRLLRHGVGAPTGAQLAEADAARRDRGAELDRAIARLTTRVARGGKPAPR